MSAIAQSAEVEGVIDYTRQRDWLDPTELPDSLRVQIVGVGGIGTPTALLLAKLGMPKIDLIDFDEVERHNLPNQMFHLDTQGELKAEAAAFMIEEFAPVQVNSIVGKATAEGFQVTGENKFIKPQGIVIAALDSMEARSELWQSIRMNINVPLFIDARLGGENIVVHNIVPTDKKHIEFYEETLYTDEEAVEDPCTRRSVIDVGFAVASLIGRSVRKHLAGDALHTRIFLNQDSLNIYLEA